jgi:DNA end-binding protein Ku
VPEPAERADGARALWSGTISFGLVSVPIELYPANRSVRVSLRMLAPDGTPLSRRYFCPEEDREISNEEIVRGQEVDGRWIVVTDEELESLEPRKSRDIDLRLFVERDEIDPIFFDRAYYLAPSGDSTKAYRLLAQTMEQTGRAGVATFVMRSKEYLVALVAENGLIRAETMRFADEVRTPADVGLPEAARASPERVAALEKAIRGLEEDAIDEAEMVDRNAARLLAVIEQKRAEGSDVIRAEAPARRDEEVEGVIDLMEVLKRRLAASTDRADESAEPAEEALDGAAPQLDELTKKELYERAKSLDVPGRSGMDKQELIRAIRRTA